MQNEDGDKRPLWQRTSDPSMAGSMRCPGCEAAISFAASRCPRCGRELLRKTRWAKSEISFGPVGRLGWTAAIATILFVTPYYFLLIVFRWFAEVIRDLWKPITRRVS